MWLEVAIVESLGMMAQVWQPVGNNKDCGVCPLLTSVGICRHVPRGMRGAVHSPYLHQVQPSLSLLLVLGRGGGGGLSDGYVRHTGRSVPTSAITRAARSAAVSLLITGAMWLPQGCGCAVPHWMDAAPTYDIRGSAVNWRVVPLSHTSALPRWATNTRPPRLRTVTAMDG